MTDGLQIRKCSIILVAIPQGQGLKVILFLVFVALTFPGVMKTNAYSACSQPWGHSQDRNFLLGGYNQTWGVLRAGFWPGMGPSPRLGIGPDHDALLLGR